MMYQLFCAANTYAMSAHVLLEELGVEYDLREVSIFVDRPDADFLQASPHGRVPALQHTHGTIFESGAIAQFLSDEHIESGFGVPIDHPQRAEFLQWLYYLSSTVQPEVLIQFHPEGYFEDEGLQSQLKNASLQRLNKSWRILDDAYGNAGPWLIDNRLTAVDICLAIQIQWPESFSGSVYDYPNLARMLNTISQRDAWQRTMRWHLRDQ